MVKRQQGVHNKAWQQQERVDKHVRHLVQQLVKQLVKQRVKRVHKHNEEIDIDKHE